MKIEISDGEILDRISILEIKLEKITDKQKLSNILKELSNLQKELESNLLELKNTTDYYTHLKSINLQLWNIEDQLRIKEKNKQFDEEFIVLARDVYFTNDLRADIKRKINLQSGSKIIEEKEYVDYKKV